MEHRRSAERIEEIEPACWGSAELPLIPNTLARAVSGRYFSAYRRKDNSRVDVSLSLFASMEWRRALRNLKLQDPDESWLDQVVVGVERTFRESPDVLDVPFVAMPIDRFQGLSTVPFEETTIHRLEAINFSSDSDLMVLMSGSFLELLLRLNDCRAALDFAVTSVAWMNSSDQHGFGFLSPSVPESIDDAVRLAQTRDFRCSGRPTKSAHYSPIYAALMGKRQGLGVSKKWTLDVCASAVGLTRERIRQIELERLWLSSKRNWGSSALLEQLKTAVVGSEDFVDLELATGESLDRASVARILVTFGYPELLFVGPELLSDQLLSLGLRMAEIRQMAYAETEQTGIIRRDELRHHLSHAFPILHAQLLSDVVDDLVLIGDLPHGYVYLESQKTSSVKSWLISVLAACGPLTTSEAVNALERHFKARRAGLVFPPREVVEAFIERDDSFWVSNGVAGLSEPYEREWSPIHRWVRDTICSCTGDVIHRTELWSRAREAGVKAGTLSLYTSYSLFFKPIHGGFVTLTGTNPSDVAIELAKMRASAIRVPTKRGKPKVVDGTVLIEIQVGNGLLDSGVLSTSLELRKMLMGQKFRAMAGDTQYGNINWSGDAMIGFTSIFQALSIQPGDRVVVGFAPLKGEVRIQTAPHDSVGLIWPE